MAKVFHNQSLLDIATQVDGNFFNAFQIAIENNKSITDNLIVGENLNLPKSKLLDYEIASFFNRKNILIATQLNSGLIEEFEQSGIGTMAIGKTFIVQENG